MNIPKVNTAGQVRRGQNELPDLPDLELPDWLKEKYPDIDQRLERQNAFNLQVLDVLTQIQEDIAQPES